MKQFWIMAVLAGLALGGSASAADYQKVGYVDLRKIVVESKAGRKHKAEMEKLVKDKQVFFQKEEEKLDAIKKVFEKEELTYTDAQKKQKQQEFQQKVQALQKMAQEAQQELSRKDTGYTDKALNDVRGIIGEVAKDEKVSLVLDRAGASVLYAEDGLDLTPKVMQKYDARFAK